MSGVYVGEWEKRKDLPPLKRQWHGHSGLVHEEHYLMSDRKVYEIWEEDGKKYGRWTWESGL